MVSGIAKAFKDEQKGEADAAESKK